MRPIIARAAKRSSRRAGAVAGASALAGARTRGRTSRQLEEIGPDHQLTEVEFVS